MKSSNINLVRLVSVLLCFSYLLLLSSVSAVTGRTKLTDVMALESLRKYFGLLTWTDDPCLPGTKYAWIDCSSDVTPRITAQYLSNKNLSGFLPDFSAMDALEIIDLSFNPYLGVDWTHNPPWPQEFPDFLASFPKLKVLNMTYTNFQGTIPTSLYGSYTVTFTMKSLRHACCYSDAPICGPGALPIAVWPTTSTVPAGVQISPEINWGRTPSSSNPRPQATKISKYRLPIALGTGIPTFLIILFIIGLVFNNQKKDDAPAEKSGEESSAEML